MQETVITRDFIWAGKPIAIAKVGVKCIDITTGIEYTQVTIPKGNTYRETGVKYYQPQGVKWSEIIDKPSTFPASTVSGTTTLSFGLSETTVSAFIPFTASCTSIVLSPADRVEDFTIEGISLTWEYESGVGYTVRAYAPLGANNTYTIKYTIFT